MTILQFTLHSAIEMRAEGQKTSHLWQEKMTIATTQWTLQPDPENAARTVLISVKPDLGKNPNVVAYNGAPWGEGQMKFTLHAPYQAVMKHVREAVRENAMIDLTESGLKAINHACKYGEPVHPVKGPVIGYGTENNLG